jgi:hypothetical protein
MEEHRYILDLAARNALPEQVDESSNISVTVVRELHEAGYLQAIDVSTFDGIAYLEPRITLEGREYLRKLQTDREAPEKQLIETLEQLRDLLVSVSTGGPKIQDVNGVYRQLYAIADSELTQRSIANPITFGDLWDWYGRWSSGDLPSWRSRREFIAELFNPLLKQVRDYSAGYPAIAQKPTGWPKVDRTLGEIRRRLAEAKTEEQYQAVGLLCREAIITLAQTVYDPAQHPPVDGTTHPSATDAKRMLEAYLAVALAGSSHQNARKHARAAFDLSNDLQHHRTATFRQAAMCAEATGSLINIVAIVSGRRDPNSL